MSDDFRYFVLTQDVLVPFGDWNTLEKLRDGGESFMLHQGMRLVLREGEYWTYGAMGWLLNELQAGIVEPLLVEAESKIGQWLDSCGQGYEPILAALGELGIVTADDIEKAAYRVALSYSDKVGILERNWVIEWPEG